MPPSRTAGATHGRTQRTAWLFAAPALVLYAAFVLWPLGRAVQYSLYDWNGIGQATWVGLTNYTDVLTDPDLRAAVVHAFQLIVFFTVIPVSLGLVLAALLRTLRRPAASAVARTVLFLPQVVPLVAAGIAWTWMYSGDGTVNQVLSAVGLDGAGRPWLGDFGTALPAVGLIGSWVMTGFCTVLLLTGIGRIDPALYESARLDGASWLREFRAVTLPGLRREISVLVTMTMIAALASFAIVFSTTGGGPGGATTVPGVEIYKLGFGEREIGAASALGIVTCVLVVAVVLVAQRLFRERRG